jgi:hypothetical protein
MRGLLSEVLVTWGRESEKGREQVAAFALELVASNQEGGGLLAVQVAQHLGLTMVLEQGAYSLAPYVRQLATQYIFFSFQQGDGQAGVEVLRRIQQTVKRQSTVIGMVAVLTRLNQGIDSVRGLRALLDLFVLTISLGYRYPAVIQPIGQMFCEFFETIPDFVNRAINAVLVRWGVEMVTSVITTSNQLAEMRPYANRPLRDPFRKKVASLMNYLEPRAGTLDGELGDLIFTVAHEVDLYSFLLIVGVMMTRVGPQFDSLYRLCRRLYADGNQHCKHIALRVFTLVSYLEYGRVYWRPEHAVFANQMILEMATSGIVYPKQMKRKGREGQPGAVANPQEEYDGIAQVGYGVLMELQDRRSGTLELVARIEQQPLPAGWSQAKRIDAIMTGLFAGIAVGVATSKLNIVPVLETIQRYFTVSDPDEQKAVAAVLTRLRSFFPAEVDMYLIDAPKWLRLGVQSDFRPLSLGQISNAGLQCGLPWLFRVAPKFRQAFADILADMALNSQNFDQYMPTFVKKFLTLEVLEGIAQAMANVDGQVR